MKILQVNFKIDVPPDHVDQVMQGFIEGAKKVANVDGLIWKIYMEKQSEKIAGAIYLFKDEASAQAYLNGPIIARMKSMPIISNIETKIFDVMPELTKITRGPC